MISNTGPATPAVPAEMSILGIVSSPDSTSSFADQLASAVKQVGSNPQPGGGIPTNISGGQRQNSDTWVPRAGHAASERTRFTGRPIQFLPVPDGHTIGRCVRIADQYASRANGTSHSSLPARRIPAAMRSGMVVSSLLHTACAHFCELGESAGRDQHDGFSGKRSSEPGVAVYQRPDQFGWGGVQLPRRRSSSITSLATRSRGRPPTRRPVLKATIRWRWERSTRIWLWTPSRRSSTIPSAPANTLRFMTHGLPG